jgi:hypothetical protein
MCLIRAGFTLEDSCLDMLLLGMLTKLIRSGEPSLADRAAVRLKVEVGVDVFLQFLIAGICLVADTAGEALRRHGDDRRIPLD